jgi:hypothetical protein
LRKVPTNTGLAAPAYLIYEDTPRYDWSLKLILGAVLAATAVAGVIIILYDVAGGLAMFGVTLLDALIFYLVVPRRYQIFNTKLRIVLGGPFNMDIPLSSIKEARPAPAAYALGYWGIRFATSTSGATEIIRRKGWNVIISPSDREVFLARLAEALEAAQASAAVP